MDELIAQVKTGERAAGVDELLVPERGERRRRDLTERGVIPLEAAAWQILTSACGAPSVPHPAEVSSRG